MRIVNDNSSFFFGKLPDINAELRIFCFPYAGGGASMFNDWQDQFPDNIQICPIQIPGRENRFAEPPLQTVARTAEATIPALLGWLSYPYAFFGHSLGAKIAFELILKIQHFGLKPPACLIVSACQAPHIPDLKPIAHLPDSEFINELKRISPGKSDSLNDKTIRDIYLPLLRADFEMSESYLYRGDRQILTCPVFVLGGEHDTEVRLGDLDDWQIYTRKKYRRYLIPGGHMFIHDERDQVIRAILGISQEVSGL